MIVDLRKFITSISIPALILAVSVFFIQYLAKPLPTPIRELLPLTPYALILLGMILSWIFHHSREFNLFLLLGVIYLGLNNYLWNPVDNFDTRLAFALLTIITVFNYFLNFILKERGILNHYGIRRFVFLGIQLFCVAWLLENPLPEVKAFFDYKIPSIPYFKLTTIPDIIGAATMALIALLLFKLMRCPSCLMAGIVTSFIAVMFALHYVSQIQLSMIFISYAALFLIISIVMNAYSLAYLDELTNLPSRRALKQSISSLGKRYVIGMVDVDFFKKFNDKYGHDIGDQVLKKLASQLRQTRSANAFRYGGEEFTLLFPNKDMHEARLACEELCKRVANSPFLLRGRKRPKHKPGDNKKSESSKSKPLKITISIGLAEKNSETGSVEDVIKQADKALYKAKKNGRNQVAV